MGHDVDGGVIHPEGVDAREDFRLMEPKRHGSSEPCWVEVIMLMGVDQGVYLQEASKICRSFFPGFSRICG
jgi:hypothetical protein